MIRYFITFPAGVAIRPEQLDEFRRYLKEAADDKEWRDIITNAAATLHDVRYPRMKPKFNQMRPR